MALMRGIKVFGSKAAPAWTSEEIFRPPVSVRLPWLHGVWWVYMVIESMAIYIKNPEEKKKNLFFHWSFPLKQLR